VYVYVKGGRLKKPEAREVGGRKGDGDGGCGVVCVCVCEYVCVCVCMCPAHDPQG
jgi:hypothetical protein